MKTILGALVTISALGLLAGCGDSSAEIKAFDEPTFIAFGAGDPEENGGVNGTPNAAYHAYLSSVVTWMNSPLFVAITEDDLNPAILTSTIISDSGGREIFRHLIECTMPEGTLVSVSTAGGQFDFPGKGIVAGGDAWGHNSLSDTVKNNVVECIAAFINDDTVGVEIGLTGMNINPGSEDYSHLTLPEAIWCFTPVSNSMDVFVTPAFEGTCGIDPEAALQKRYCGDESNCGFTYHGLVNNNVDSSCLSITDGKWICNGKVCTQTWLDPLVDIPHCDPGVNPDIRK